jgi:D-lactate dehydrogenase (cytochrome)
MLTEETEFSTNPYELDRHGRGESYHRGYLIDDGNVTPDMIVRPRTVQDVSAILRFCNDSRIPVIPYGAGTSVEGHVCAIKNGTISLDMNAFQTIVLPGEDAEEDENDNTNGGDDNDDEEKSLLPDPIARVGAGVTRKALNEALRHTGMQFVVDPGADASLGGMVATGASGTTTVRYGTIRENILELECVLADGTIVEQIGTKALKSSAGYDLLGLMCGSEVSFGCCIILLKSKTKLTLDFYLLSGMISISFIFLIIILLM